MDKRPAPLAEVRFWARQRGLEVGTKGHLPQAVIDQFNRRHRKAVAVSTNPWSKKKGATA